MMDAPVAGTRDYDGEYDADTLIRAHEVMADPARVAKAKAAAAERAKKLGMILGAHSTETESQLQAGYRKLS